MRKIKYLILVLGIIAGFGLPVLSPTVGAIDVFQDACSGPNADNDICKGVTDPDETVPSFIKTAINIALYAIGALSVLVIIFSGVQYVTSAGDADAVKKAKNTLLYAVVGLVVALLAYAIVNFVLTSFK